jgi:hypothetical protein
MHANRLPGPDELKTPMERDYPVICAWVRHQTVQTDLLYVELQKALAFLDGADA